MLLLAVTLFDAIDTPTTFTLYKGNYQFNFCFFNGGGITGQILVGLTDFFTVGFSLDVLNAIGKGIPVFYPGFTPKICFYNDGRRYPSIALGYNYVPEGAPPNRVPKHLYLVVSKYFTVLRGDSVANVGLSFNPYREDGKPYYLHTFASLNFPIGQVALFTVEVDNIPITDTSKKVIVNAGIRFDAAEGLTLQLDFRELDLKNYPDRTFRIHYERQI